MSKKTMMILVITLLLISTACTLSFNNFYTQEDLENAVQQTVQAYQTQNVPTSVPATSAPLPTQTPLPTYTPLPAATATPVSNPTATPRPCNQAAFISETVPDGTKFGSSETFTKSWRLKNTGTCTWNPDYSLVFASGDQMLGPQSVKLNQHVKPGETVDVLVKLTSPAKTGTYTGYWKLQSDNWEKFAQVYVTIKVNAPNFAVTRVVLTSNPASYSGVCPVTLTINADITASTAGKVTYKWQRSDGVTSDTKSVKFDAKGTKSVQLDWDVNSTDIHWVRIYIDAPNHQWFGPLNIDVTCP